MSSSPMHLTGPETNEPPPREGLAIVPILIALFVVGLLGLAGYTVLAPHSVGTGTIEQVNAVEMPGGDRVVVEVEVSMTNGTDKPLKYHSTEIRLVTNNGEFKDDPTPSSEVPRVYQSYPTLKHSNEAPLKQDTMVEPGATVKGVGIVAFPVNKAGFDARKQIEALIYFYDKPPIVVKK